MAAAATDPRVPEEDRLRADLYGFLSALLAAPPDDALLRKSAALSGDGSDLGRAIQALARAASDSTAEAVESEFNALFVGVGRGELLPYASYYLTGFLNDRPLAALRDDMRALSIARAPGRSEPEDHIACVLETMAGIVAGRFGGGAENGERAFFDRHVGAWAGHFFTDLETAGRAAFYAPVGAAGRAFMEIEREAFRMTAA